VIVLAVIGGVLLVEVGLVGWLVVSYLVEERRERRECMELTREFGVSPTTVYDVVTRKTWRHV
jgi:predicted DNA-binding transcriptional regulator